MDVAGTRLGRYWDVIVEGPIPCVCEHLLCVEITTGARHGDRIYESAIMGTPSFLAIAHHPSCPFNNSGHCLWGWAQKRGSVAARNVVQASCLPLGQTHTGRQTPTSNTTRGETQCKVSTHVYPGSDKKRSMTRFPLYDHFLT